MQKYSGSCHCQAVTFEVDMELGEVLSCNCSHCSKKGFLLAFVPQEQLNILSGEENLTEYRFNKKMIAHLFCKTCGIQGFSRAELPDGKKMSAINVRCLDGVDVDTLTIKKVDGKDF